MKIINKTILILLLISSAVYTQTWEWVTPKPQGNNLSSVTMNGNTEGFAVGSMGTVMKTTDLGVTWQVQTVPTKKQLIDVAYAWTNDVFACGDSGTVIRTFDLGQNWVITPTPVSVPLRGISFTSRDTGFAAGYQGKIIRTTNQGASWQLINTNFTRNLNTIRTFIGVLHGALGGCRRQGERDLGAVL